MLDKRDWNIGIIGLGYVGLPLAVAFAKHFPVIGYDSNFQRIYDLRNGLDQTHEVSSSDLLAADQLKFTEHPDALRSVNTFIVTVPTPIDAYKKPDLRKLIQATETVAHALKKGDIVIYESTVYPGCTEEECVPVLEQISGLRYNIDFFCGYSPERINPGDKVNTLTSIKKVTSGSTPAVGTLIDSLYQTIITAGTHLASSIRVAEASKAIENAQRDLNISFMNELALIFDKMGLDTSEVLDAASTKWNFLPYKPGLVGGHCIGVDPYYLTYKAESLGYYPEVILSGRRVNDQMGIFVAQKMVKLMTRKGLTIEGARVLILGITFKENCPDIRNTRVVDVYQELTDFGLQVDVYDPWASPEQVKSEYQIALTPTLSGKYEGVILAVAHSVFKKIDLTALTYNQSTIYDLKSVLPRTIVDARL